MIISQLKNQFMLSIRIFKFSVSKIPFKKSLFCYTTRHNLLARSCHHHLDKDDEETNIPDFKKIPCVKRRENLSSAKRISDGLKCKEYEALEMLETYPKLRSITSNNLTKRCQLLAEKNITTDIIINNPWILFEDKKLLDEKLELLKCYRGERATSAVTLLQLPMPRLKKVLEWNKSKPLQGQSLERIDFLSDKLKCNETEVCELLHKHQFLLTVPFQRMQAVLKLLEDAGVDKLDIQRDLWILRYQPAQVKARLDLARDANMLKIKPWMARSTESIFHKSIERYKASQHLLGSDSNVLEFLTRRLGLSEPEQLISIARTHPPLLRASPIKLDSVLDALFHEGFTKEQIIRSPRVLCHSLATTLDRLKLLRESYNHEPKGLGVLCLSLKQFTHYVQRIKRMRSIES